MYVYDITCLSAGPTPSTFEPIRRFLCNVVEGHAIEGDLEVIIFKTTASTIPKMAGVQTSDRNTTFPPSTWGCDDRCTEDEQLIMTPLSRKTKIRT
jgi:hypothetical protein